MITTQLFKKRLFIFCRSMDFDEITGDTPALPTLTTATVTAGTTQTTTAVANTTPNRTVRPTLLLETPIDNEVAGPSTPVINEVPSSDIVKSIGPPPCEAPDGFKWVLKWDLVPESQPVSPMVSTPTLQHKSFEQSFLDKIKSPKPRGEGRKRQKLDLKAAVCY